MIHRGEGADMGRSSSVLTVTLAAATTGAYDELMAVIADG